MPIQSLIHLREILSELYDNENAIRLFCQDVKLDMRQIRWTGEALAGWNDVLDEAQKLYEVGHIYVYARHQYPRNRQIREAFDRDIGSLDPDAIAAAAAEADLYDLVLEAGVHGDVLEQCHGYAVGDLLAKDRPKPGGNLALAVISLWDLPEPQRCKPVLGFAQRIANHARAALGEGGARQADKIEQWMESPGVRDALAVQPEDAARIRRDLAAEASGAASGAAAAGRLCLLVAVAPDAASFQGTRHERFQIGLYPYAEGPAGQNGRHEPRWSLPKQWEARGESFPIENLPEIILDAVDELVEHYGKEVSIIEFFLPLELMEQGVDQWEVRRRMREKLLSRGQIVVRSWELEMDGQLKAARRRRYDKWTSFSEWRQRRLRRETQEEFTPCCWDNPHALNPDAVWNDYYMRHDLAHTGVGMAFLPPVAPSRTAPQVELLDVLIEAGVPIMLWLRDGPLAGAGGTAFLAELKELVREAAPDDLPGAIHERRKSTADPEHWIHDLALYWDNPDHRLPQANKPA